MPTFPDTERGQRQREAFNARRRELYHEGLRQGLSRREAGHLYSEEQARPRITRALAGLAKSLRDVHQPDFVERARQRGTLEKYVPLNTDRDRPDFQHVQFHVAVTLKNEAGDTKEFVFTSSSRSEDHTLQRLVDDASRVLRENERERYADEDAGFSLYRIKPLGRYYYPTGTR